MSIKKQKTTWSFALSYPGTDNKVSEAVGQSVQTSLVSKMLSINFLFMCFGGHVKPSSASALLKITDPYMSPKSRHCTVMLAMSFGHFFVFEAIS